MLKSLYLAFLVAATAILLACSDPTPVPTSTPAPTATPVPTNTPAPTATPVPTNTPKPAPATASTERPDESAEKPVSGGIAPLNMEDPVAVASELSESELACLAGSADTDRLLQLLVSPELASPEEQIQLIECLEDETLLRIFLTGIIGETGTLSEETSACIRAGTEGIDLRSVMLAGIGGDEQTAMVGSMSAFFVSLACLNEEEWETAGPALDMDASDQESMQCVLEELGGPEGLAATLETEGEAGFLALLGAATKCGLDSDAGTGG